MGASFNRGGSRQDYRTPPEFIRAALNLFQWTQFTWDLAANEDNSVANHFFTEENDSLSKDWNQLAGYCWLNPPFSNITPWVKKAAESKEARIALLVPASVGSNWWRDYVHGVAYVHFLNGRLTFVGETTPYPKDCALLIYQPGGMVGYNVWEWKKQVA